MPGMSIQAKICGLSTPEAVETAVSGGAAFIGFVFFDPSPRNLILAQGAALAADVPCAKVGLFVDPSDAHLDVVLAEVPLDILQLHGTESPDRVAAIKARTGLPAMKTIAVEAAADLDRMHDYADIADMFLFDAKPPAGSPVPGGNALAFDWTVLAGARIPRPWMLAGGLTPENVAQAIDRTGAKIVDVSSGMERERGIKDPALINAFLKAIHTAAT